MMPFMRILSLVVASAACLLFAESFESWRIPPTPWYLGDCYNSSQGEIDRSGTVIRIVSYDWMSHKLVTYIAAIILREFLRYKVELVEYHGDKYYKAFQGENYPFWRTPLNWDVDLENWKSARAEFEPALLREPQYLVDAGFLDPPSDIGYSGRSGLYVMNSTLQEIPFDYYKVYSIPGFARSNGFRGVDTSALRDLHSSLGVPLEKHDCTIFDTCGKTDETYASYYIPPVCEKNLSACIEVMMGPQGYDTAVFEQLARNIGPLYMIFAYHNHAAMVARQAEIVKSGEKVVFYSWFPNWDAVGRGAVRMSFPDFFNGCWAGDIIAGDSDEHVQCDYPELALKKVISSSLQGRAPEAFFFLRQFEMTREKLTNMFQQVSAEEDDQGLFRTACRAVQNDKQLTAALRDWDCVLSDRQDGKTFHPTRGMCVVKPKPHDFKCFGNEAPVSKGLAQHKARAGTIIRIVDRGWTSHTLMAFSLGILLSEFLGYTVLYEDGGSFAVCPRWWSIIEAGIADVDPENWCMDPSNDREVALYTKEMAIVLYPTLIGWSGREGLYVNPSTLKEYPNADYYRFYQGLTARNAGFSTPNVTEIPAKLHELEWMAENATWSPPWCLQDPGSCIEVILWTPTWEIAEVATQLVGSHKLNLVIAMYGSANAQARIREIAREGLKALFYLWTPEALTAELGILELGGRVSFPDYVQGCNPGDDKIWPISRRACDLKRQNVRKIIASSLERRAPEAVYLIENFWAGDNEINALFSHLYSNASNAGMSLMEGACWFLKAHPQIAEKAAPPCISDPKPNELVRVGDFIWNQQLKRCEKLFCDPTHMLDFITKSDLNNKTEATCAPCSTPSAPGLVPTRDQLGCFACPAGQAAIRGVECAECPAGKYTDEMAMNYCKECSESKYNPLQGSSVCAVCPKGGRCSKGSSVFSALPGFYLLGDENLTANIRIAFEQWKNGNDFNSNQPHGFEGIGPFACPAKAACLGDNRCIEHNGKPAMEGPFCGACARGFTRAYAVDVCNECPPEVQSWIIFVVGLIGFGLVVFVIDRMQAANVGNIRETSGVILKIVCNFMILLSAMASNCGIKSILEEASNAQGINSVYVKPLMALLKVGQALENPGKAVFAVSCFVADPKYTIEPEYVNVFLGWVVIPIVVLLACISVGITKCFWREEFRFNDVAQSQIVVIMYFMHPMVTSLFLTTFDCTEYDPTTNLPYDTLRLSLNSKIDCYSAEHNRWLWSSICGLLLWSFGIPAMYYVKLYRITNSSKTLRDPDSQRKFGFLYEGFDPECYYYECIFMLRKVVYLLAARLPWLAMESRTVLLLAINFVFLVGHLTYQPLDNRAYFGLDRLETWSSITLICLLLGRVLDASIVTMPSSSFRDNAKVAFVPALISLVWFFAQALYLLLRTLVWPLTEEQSAICPRFMSVFDKRVYFTMVPEPFYEGDPEHVLVGKCYNFYDHGPTDKKIEKRERDLLKDLLTDVIDVALERHEMCAGRAPAIICLPTLFVQIERLMIMSMTMALKSRIDTKYRNLSRNTWMKFFKSGLEDVAIYAQSVARGRASTKAFTDHLDFSRRSCEHLQREQELLRRPVSTEEIQVALMTMKPSLLDSDAHAEEDEMIRRVQDHQGIMDMCSKTAWVFERSAHLEILEKYDRRPDDTEKDKLIALHEQDESIRSLQELLPQCEVWEDPLALCSGTNWLMIANAEEEPEKAPEDSPSLGPWHACRQLWNLSTEEPAKDSQSTALALTDLQDCVTPVPRISL